MFRSFTFDQVAGRGLMLRYDLLGEKRIAGGNSTQAFMKWGEMYYSKR